MYIRDLFESFILLHFDVFILLNVYLFMYMKKCFYYFDIDNFINPFYDLV